MLIEFFCCRFVGPGVKPEVSLGPRHQGDGGKQRGGSGGGGPEDHRGVKP